jgi:hypothetical protein
MAVTSYSFVLVGAVILVLYFISKLVLWIQRYRFAKSKGCEPVPVYPQRETILGYDYFKALNTSSKNQTFFLDSIKLLDQLGDTYHVKTFGKQVFHTRDPENFKWTWSTDFKNFKNGWRLKPFGRLLGRDLILIDGAEWEHSRVAIRFLIRGHKYLIHARLAFVLASTGLKLQTSAHLKPTSRN